MNMKHVQIVPMEGKDELRVKMKALVETPGFRGVVSLGVVRDADSDPHGAFQSVCDSLRYVGLSLPARCLESFGTNPRVSIMLMPKNNTPGMLEDLCLESVRTDPAFLCMEQYFECLQSKNLPRPREISKAKIHAFLASREKPDLRLGVAAENGYWPFNNETFQELKGFLRLVST